MFLALLLDINRVHTSLCAGAKEHVAKGYAAMAAARDAGAAAEHEVEAAMSDANQLLAMALAVVANGSIDAHA